MIAHSFWQIHLCETCIFQSGMLQLSRFILINVGLIAWVTRFLNAHTLLCKSQLLPDDAQHAGMRV